MFTIHTYMYIHYYCPSSFDIINSLQDVGLSQFVSQLSICSFSHPNMSSNFFYFISPFHIYTSGTCSDLLDNNLAFVHLSSCSLAACLAQLHFNLLALTMTCYRPYFCLTSTICIPFPVSSEHYSNCYSKHASISSFVHKNCRIVQ